MTTPTLINLPPHPAESATPSDMGPGTPNSGTTSLSALSTTAIKDGHQGHTLPHGHHHHSVRDSTSSNNTLDAERADRISRLAGLERVATVRPSQSSNLNPGSGPNPPPGYFDNAPPQVKERSTVGSASATGSVGGRTTWASGSIDYDADKMSEDQDDGVSSNGGFSDENASLVGFGEGAGSTVSVPISTTTSRAAAARYHPASSPSTSKFASTPSAHMPQVGTPMSGVVPTSTTTTVASSTDPRMMDGMSYDASVIDTTMQVPTPVSQPQHSRGFSGQGADMAESIMRDRLPDNEAGRPAMSSPDERGEKLGKFPFERR
ncbi:hypothetical protein GJ744_009115 [Endocarpon pusillum]|uniref:Uncharacterized protein n=1 Tax=Endocarpon pusillum TaxID=364733 RepID=A0A8H7AK95_9EURO|nr:hypothetical protein GJ744_009115 [Endocarpon pusillum]